MFSLAAEVDWDQKVSATDEMASAIFHTKKIQKALNIFPFLTFCMGD
jgi:hypothetical protein